jgi:hypothetical protein
MGLVSSFYQWQAARTREHVFGSLWTPGLPFVKTPFGLLPSGQIAVRKVGRPADPVLQFVDRLIDLGKHHVLNR